ncbi:hypothetical protein [Natrinema salaciae]|uniref:hypothetical protein n=1 Tax=Natrinema salaciae TaxID=1186196 RepID=UPI0011134CC8|nr:hypothetical protein [Natrinema salaciae]
MSYKIKMNRRQALKSIGGTVTALSIGTLPAAGSSSGDYNVAYEAVRRNLGQRTSRVDVELEWEVDNGEISYGHVSHNQSTAIDWRFLGYTEKDSEETDLQLRGYTEAKFDAYGFFNNEHRIGLEVIGLTNGEVNTNVPVDTADNGRVVVNEI